ncbi:MAG: MltA domain-containing protein [Alphaproteobacteria bacterium]|nr:MltA domain-containing protein [Alphaproteobacteria bacterium]
MRKFLIMILCLMVGCSTGHQFSQGRAFKLSAVSWDDLKGWKEDNLLEALPALRKSCQKPVQMFERFCQGLAGISTETALRAHIEKTLEPYQVKSYGQTTGKITGYYEAELTGSRVQRSSTQLPIYGAPEGYVQGKSYPTRSAIFRKSLDAPIIAWADNEIDLFIMHVQGSGRLVTPEGEVIHLGFAGSNGRKFTGLGALMLSMGIAQESARSMPDIRAWSLANPEKAHELMMKNDRFIFFKEVKGETPIGSAGVALTPERSLAVDKDYIPMHTPMWLETTTPDGWPLKQLMVAQDTGAAIKGGIRADFFWGYGDNAFVSAGHMNQAGRYYLLLPR